MLVLSIDLETYSPVDLSKAGVYKYASHPEFEILLFAFSLNHSSPELFERPTRHSTLKINSVAIQEILEDPKIIKTAFNAQFERICLEKYYKINLPPDQWQCSSIYARYLGLPGDLAGAAKYLKTGEQKDAAGKRLINYFSKPCRPTKANGGRIRNLPEHDPEKWEQFKEYCLQDVKTETAIRQKLEDLRPFPDRERALYALDQKINDRGVAADPELIRCAVDMDAQVQAKMADAGKKLTGLENPNSVAQLKKWLSEKTGLQVDQVTKQTVAEMLALDLAPEVRRVLELRRDMAKTSIKKYRAMENSIGDDHRIRGLFQFYGAARTGRWAGRLVQMQNLPQNKMGDLGLARELLKRGDADALELLFGDIPPILSQLIRTAFVAPPGKVLLVSDFSAIEARVIAWLAGEEWRLKVFRGHGKIYEASAAAAFGVPIEDIAKDSPLRQQGKVLELACGFGGGYRAVAKMDYANAIAEEARQDVVRAWRKANPKIVAFWKACEAASMRAIELRETVSTGYLKMWYAKGTLSIGLPSGRALNYPNAKIEIDELYNRPRIAYDGMEQGKGFGRLSTYGGKLAENVVQAVARDCLAEALLRLKDRDIIMHVHDEVVLEVPEKEADLNEINGIMKEEISWAPGLPLAAEGFITKYYKKD